MQKKFSGWIRNGFIVLTLISPLALSAEDSRETCRAAMEECTQSAGATLARPERGQAPTEEQRASMEKVRTCMEAKNLNCGRGPGFGPGRGKRGPGKDGQLPPDAPTSSVNQ